MRRIGLLGGSFNPAHDGHRHISLYALKMLGLDEVWWMVSPQNPLKPIAGMAPLAERVAAARLVAKHPRIRVTDIERKMGTRYTVDTLTQLKQRFPDTAFTWLMGTDNLLTFHKWRQWERIFALVPVVALDRPPRGSWLKACPAAIRFQKDLKILHIPLNFLSATALREMRA